MVRLIKGNRVWTIESAFDVQTGGYLTRKTYGVENGKMTVKVRPVKPKGGRTPEQQVELELNSAVSKQRDKGYHSPDEEPPRLILPMLAKVWDPCKITYPVALQEKLNGVRCVAERRGNEIFLTTRKGKPITSMDHIKPHLLDLMVDSEVYDGELFNRHMSLQQISGAVRRTKADDESRTIEYWVYDRIDNGTFQDRFMNQPLHDTSLIRKVPTFMAYTIEGIDMYYDSIVNQGGEGIIIRNLHSLYQCDKRPWDLMKRKDFMDAEFEIIGWKRDVDGCVIWTCQTKDWKTFDVVPVGSKESRQMSDALADTYVGKPLTVRYSELSDDGIPQGNPVGLAIRDYE